MSKKLYITKRISNGNGRLEYYLKEDVFVDEEKRGVPVFGIEVTEIRAEQEGGEELQTAKIDGLSVNRERVLEFLYMLSDMEVMPVHLADVVEDFLQDDFFIIEKNSEMTA